MFDSQAKVDFNPKVHPKTIMETTLARAGEKPSFSPLFRVLWKSIAGLVVACSALNASAQYATTIFADDFAGNTIDPARYQPDAPFFEGGVGDIHATAHDGVIEFVGTTTQQWWSGGTLSVAQPFTASEKAAFSVTIDRVAEAGVGTASRSALWILDETKTKYVLFADVRAEGGWRFNRKIGEDGDVPTGSGTDIALFNGGTFDDGGLHQMKMVADGKTVKLYLDGQMGAEVKFPFSKVLVQFGSYARANNDTASTTWDNLKIESIRQTTVVFADDFASGTIDPAKYQPDAPFFEGGTGDIHAEARNGAIEFVGTTSQQWWAGGTLRVVPTFTATEDTPVIASIDRVAEAGVGTASRSALWILDESQTKYVLFADVRAEGGWRFNRKIGEDGDVPTGSGTDIALFNGASFDDGGLHRMKIVANGKTAKLYLDDQLGAEVKFPFSKVMFHFGSYARANNDTASTTWDNLRIETIPRSTTVLLADDFASNAIDLSKYVPSAPFFEGGTGDIHAEARNGAIEFVGTTTQQWWAGGTLRVVPVYEASESSVVTASIDRVAEAGVGTASRSALWILDETRTKYVLFADVRAEGGWRFNRKIGEDGDVPTGSGTDIALFNGAAYDDGGLHRMSMIADGKTVKLLLDGVQGAEVKFPFNRVVFEFGSYARANNDTAMTVWDNLRIETAGAATLSPNPLTVRMGGSGVATVRIPPGMNAQSAVQVRIVSSTPAVAVAEGATGGTLNLTFPAGGPNVQEFRVNGLALGTTQLSVEGDIGSSAPITIAVISGPGVQLSEDFSGAAINTTRWVVSNRGFETGTGTFTVAQVGGQLVIDGITSSEDPNYWAGATLKSVNSYVATKDVSLSVEVDRVSLAQIGTAGRSGVYLTTGDRSRFVYFGQNTENNWQVNVNPGSPAGGGTAIAAFGAATDALSDAGAHRIKMVADGSFVEVFLDGVSGGRFPFEVSSGIFVELAGSARAAGDGNTAIFDNAKIEYLLPCVKLSDSSVSMTVADAPRAVTVTIPRLLNDAAPVAVTVTSQNPAVAVASGSVNGVLTLNFAAGAANSQTFLVQPLGLGAANFTVASAPSACLAGGLRAEVVAVPLDLFTDGFATAIDLNNWTIDPTPFDPNGGGTATADSAITVANGQARMNVVAETAAWPGLALFTKASYDATATEPVTFEVDRSKLEFVLVTGTGANQRSGVWVKDPAGNFVFFSENVAHDGRNFGWRYNKLTGAANDNPTDAGINISAFDGGTFDNQGSHRMKIVANGSSVKLYLDGVLGVEIPFPTGTDLTFGIGTYVAAATDVATGYFDNVVIKGGAKPVGGTLSAAKSGSNLVISWTGTGVLQQNDTATATGWSDVNPAPTGNSHTIAPGAQVRTRFYRLR